MKKYKKKAQAILEMGILGSIILIIFGSLVVYMQRMNDDQYALQASFRKALKRAHDGLEILPGLGSIFPMLGGGAIVNYTVLDDRMHASVQKPVAGQRTTVTGSSLVHWAVPKVGEQPNRIMVYDINGQPVWLPMGFSIGDEVSLNFSIDGIYRIYDTETENILLKDETHSDITTTRSVEIDEQRTYILALKPSLSFAGGDGYLDIVVDLAGDLILDEIEERIEDITHTFTGIPIPIRQNFSVTKTRTWVTQHQ